MFHNRFGASAFPPRARAAMRLPRFPAAARAAAFVAHAVRPVARASPFV
eukprot:SAG31_NODE_28086_length_415_cov_1.613924_1_plen_48_part_01